jgi:hypothetical protein
MKWFDSYKYKPKHGTQIFVWDFHNQKQILLNAFWDAENWHPEASFPFWTYVLDGVEPDFIDQPERSKREDAECFINCKRSMCEFNNLCNDHNCKPVMRCSEHKG